MVKKSLILCVLVILLSGCGSVPAATPSISPSAIVLASPTFLPTQTQTLIPSPTPFPLITTASSPLQGISVDDLYLITSNPFVFKYPFVEASGTNYNHTGLDLAFFHFKEFDTVLGHPIQAVLPGKVVESLNNRWPFGNMVLIETPLSVLSPEYLASIPMPTPLPESEIQARSECQPDQTRISWSQTNKSIYILYAHMQKPSSLTASDFVKSGQVIGGVGSSGNAEVGAEHLHLEVRLGPSDAHFGVISDYLPSSSEEERYNYCIWALSEVFQPFDPSLLWKNPPETLQ